VIDTSLKAPDDIGWDGADAAADGLSNCCKPDSLRLGFLQVWPRRLIRRYTYPPLQRTRRPADRSRMALIVSEIWLRVLTRGSNLMKRGDYASAERMFRAALLVMHAIPTAKAREGRALALYHLSLLRGKQNRDAEARKLREQAAAYQASGAGWMQNGLFHYLMAGDPFL